MATVPNFGSGFNADAFRSAIKNTLQMASPNAAMDKAIFQWDAVTTYDPSVKVDSSGRPYDLSAAASTTVQHEDVQVNVAVEFSDGSPHGSPLGVIDQAQAILTILDDDYELVAGCSKVKLGGNTYLIDFWAPPIGLFSVTIYTAYTHAISET